MKTNPTNMLPRNKNIIFIALAVALLLLLVWLAMRFTGTVNWSTLDFATAGALLFGTGLAYELLTRKAGSLAYRAAAGAALAAVLLLVWINLAVGIIGSEDNPANIMYIGVLAVGLIGALIARFRAPGMARALCATALAQALVTLVALIADKSLPVVQMVMLNGFFVALWLGAAWLFQCANASENRPPA